MGFLGYDRHNDKQTDKETSPVASLINKKVINHFLIFWNTNLQFDRPQPYPMHQKNIFFSKICLRLSYWKTEEVSAFLRKPFLSYSEKNHWGEWKPPPSPPDGKGLKLWGKNNSRAIPPICSMHRSMYFSINLIYLFLPLIYFKKYLLGIFFSRYSMGGIS